MRAVATSYVAWALFGLAGVGLLAYLLQSREPVAVVPEPLAVNSDKDGVLDTQVDRTSATLEDGGRSLAAELIAPAPNVLPEVPQQTTPSDYESRYAGMTKSQLVSAGMELGDSRVQKMLALAEGRFQTGRFETRGFLARGEKTPQHTSLDPLIIERVLPTGEYQVVEFSQDEYPELYALKEEQDWVFNEARQRP